MRIGENPTKYARKSSGKATIPVKISLPLTVCSVTFVPHLEGYYKDGLDILKLTFGVLRQTTDQKFDLVVFDNGSCKEVVDWLVLQKENNVIQNLILSSENMKKMGAFNALFSLPLGNRIYYFDSDIYHYSGWLDEMGKVLDIFPEAGLVGAFHNLPEIDEDSVNNISPEYLVQHGEFVSVAELKTIANSLGADVNDFLDKKKDQKQIQITHKGISTLMGASHCQFLIKKECVEKIFPKTSEWAATHTDKDFDFLLKETGYLRLTTSKQYVYHIGNFLEGEWRSKSNKMVEDKGIPLPTVASSQTNQHFGMVLKFWPVRKIIIFLYNKLFNLMYRL